MVVDITRRERLDELQCERCPAPLREVRFASGGNWTAEQLAAYGRQKFDAMLCMSCYRKANKERRWQRQGRAPGDPGPRTAESVLHELRAYVRALKSDVGDVSEDEASRMVELLDLVDARISKIKDGMGKPAPGDAPPTVTLPDSA